jgi:hypothetical protein
VRVENNGGRGRGHAKGQGEEECNRGRKDHGSNGACVNVKKVGGKEMRLEDECEIEDGMWRGLGNWGMRVREWVERLLKYALARTRPDYERKMP